ERPILSERQYVEFPVVVEISHGDALHEKRKRKWKGAAAHNRYEGRRFGLLRERACSISQQDKNLFARADGEIQMTVAIEIPCGQNIRVEGTGRKIVGGLEGAVPIAIKECDHRSTSHCCQIDESILVEIASHNLPILTTRVDRRSQGE